MKPKDKKRAIEQLIGDIQDGDWYFLQEIFERELEPWEKKLVMIGLRKLLSDADFVSMDQRGVE